MAQVGSIITTDKGERVKLTSAPKPFEYKGQTLYSFSGHKWIKSRQAFSSMNNCWNCLSFTVER